MTATQRAILLRERTARKEKYKKTMMYKLRACVGVLAMMDELDDHTDRCRSCSKGSVCRVGNAFLTKVDTLRSTAWAAIAGMDLGENS